MDTILLDTITFDQLIHCPQDLSRKATMSINQADTVLISVASLWEMTTHVRNGKIKIMASFDSYINDALATFSVGLLPIDWQALTYLTTFDIIEVNKPFEKKDKDGTLITGFKKDQHKDPFDRMILAHALALNLPIVSPDQLFPYYKSLGLKLIW